MRYFVVIDTNVLVSAMLKRDSVPGSILQLAFSGTIVPVYNDGIIDEYQKVLMRPKFHLTETIVRDAVSTLMERGLSVAGIAQDIRLPDSKDAVFYEVVMDARRQEDTFLVTGNMRHFPQQSFIVTPRQLLDIILSDTLEKV